MKKVQVSDVEVLKAKMHGGWCDQCLCKCDVGDVCSIVEINCDSVAYVRASVLISRFISKIGHLKTDQRK